MCGASSPVPWNMWGQPPEPALSLSKGLSGRAKLDGSQPVGGRTAPDPGPSGPLRRVGPVGGGATHIPPGSYTVTVDAYTVSNTTGTSDSTVSLPLNVN